MHHILTEFGLVVDHDHPLVQFRFFENVLLEPLLDFKDAFSTHLLPETRLRVDSCEDQIVDHVVHVSQREGLAVDKDDRLLAQIHPGLLFISQELLRWNPFHSGPECS